MSTESYTPFDALEQKNQNSPFRLLPTEKNLGIDSRKVESDKDGSYIKVKNGDNLWKIAQSQEVKQYLESVGFGALTLDQRVDMIAAYNNKTPLDRDKKGLLSPYVIYPEERIGLPANPFSKVTNN